MPRAITHDETKFMGKLKRLLDQQPASCALYFTPSGVQLHDVSDAKKLQFEPTQSIDVATYSGVTDCGDY